MTAAIFNKTLFNITQPELENQARLLAEALVPPCCIALWGDLGAGKSTFARAFIRTLSPIFDIPSPTFTLVQTYPSSKGEIWHCDLYRLKSPSNIEDLGLQEAFYHHICLIEWPERLGDFLPKNRYNVFIKIGLADRRHYRLEV